MKNKGLPFGRILLMQNPGLTINKRIVFEGGVYHIIQRAPGRELLFLEKSDYLHFLAVLKETVKKFNLDLFCFALLPNHLHLLLRINKSNLSSAMKNLFERYADYFNKKYRRKGHVFCGRYRASFCNSDDYLLAASLYIHINPYKATLCKHPKEYRWSSLNLYLENSKKSFVNYEFILSLLHSQMEEARKKYLEMIDESLKSREEAFLDLSYVKKIIGELVKITKRFFNKKDEKGDLEKLLDSFRKKKRVVKPEDKEARKYLIQQLIANGYKVKDITEELQISRASLYRILNPK
ncbi:MAG: hypothetical protein DRP81_03970 [Candidatus Omnitrophota bacterium]|nr:MAG: hypothetical protein DRP81_03970 [Candidatus Omnitrophota bacterium]